MYERYLKRIFDILLSLIGIALCSVPVLIIALIIKLDSPGPAIFCQTRLGKDGKPFTMYKLRSMTSDENNKGQVTRIGRFIRLTSIDELPQLINVLKGDMSLIGPRPVLPDDPYRWDEYTDEDKKRFFVLPGISGWAAVNGRRRLSVREKFSLDNYYVDNLSLRLDLKILFMTVKVVLTREGNEDCFEKQDKNCERNA